MLPRCRHFCALPCAPSTTSRESGHINVRLPSVLCRRVPRVVHSTPHIMSLFLLHGQGLCGIWGILKGLLCGLRLCQLCGDLLACWGHEQRILSSHIPPCHRHMVIATTFGSLLCLAGMLTCWGKGAFSRSAGTARAQRQLLW